MAVITVIGSGVMGSAMSFPAKTNGHTVRLVGTMLDHEIITHAKKTGFHINLKRKLPEGTEYYQLDELDQALADVDLIIGGVSSFGVEWFAGEIIPRLPAGIPILSVTKGMINHPNGKLISYPGFYSSKSPDKDFCAIGGPCTSYELADLDNTHICFCGNNMNSLLVMKSLLQTPFYYISLTTDIEGLECAVALKNAYALAVSLTVGLSLKKDNTLHYNSQAAVFGQSIKEMKKLLALYGYSDDNIIYGAGDLYVTVFGGRTRQIGTLLGMGHTFDSAMNELKGVTLESIVITKRIGESVKTLANEGKADINDFPLLNHIYEIINENKQVNIPWDKFCN